jgi:protein SCO1/2
LANDSYKGKVYVPRVSLRLVLYRPRNESKHANWRRNFGNPNSGIVSITIDPKHDTPKVLKEHAWVAALDPQIGILTGDREYILTLAK